jgi:hypothetical protein
MDVFFSQPGLAKLLQRFQRRHQRMLDADLGGVASISTFSTLQPWRDLIRGLRRWKCRAT